MPDLKRGCTHRWGWIGGMMSRPAWKLSTLKAGGSSVHHFVALLPRSQRWTSNDNSKKL